MRCIASCFVWVLLGTISLTVVVSTSDASADASQEEYVPERKDFRSPPLESQNFEDLTDGTMSSPTFRTREQEGEVFQIAKSMLQ